MISTTKQKAKFVQPFAEKLITLAKNGSLHSRRRAITLLQNRDICKVENGQPVKVTTVIQRLFSEVGPRFENRNGGYTRIIKLPLRRIGDNSQLVLLQLLGPQESKPQKKRRPRAESVASGSQTVSTDTVEDQHLDDQQAKTPEESTEGAVAEDKTTSSEGHDEAEDDSKKD